MKLKTVREHQNEHGAAFLKTVGSTYEVADEAEAKSLIGFGYVEEVKDTKPAAKSDAK
jgi:hypothetical protein